MTPPILPDHAPGIGWAIADLLGRARHLRDEADRSAVKSRDTARRIALAAEYEAIADTWRGLL